MMSPLVACWLALLLSAALPAALAIVITHEHIGHEIYDQISSFSKACTSGVFLDFGSNRGVQLYKLYHPTAFEGAQLKDRFQAVFGSNLTNVCAISFEPNPHHIQSIREFADHCREHHEAKILQLSQVALWSEDGNATFYLSPYQKTEEGASLFLRKIYDHPETDQVHIRLLSTAHVLRAIRKTLSPDVPVLVKMDIEGAEFEVLRSLVLGGAICLANEYNIEYHYKFMKTFSKDNSKFMKYLAEGCGVQINSLDDETGIGFDLRHPEFATIDSDVPRSGGEGHMWLMGALLLVFGGLGGRFFWMRKQPHDTQLI